MTIYQELRDALNNKERIDDIRTTIRIERKAENPNTEKIKSLKRKLRRYNHGFNFL